MKRALYLLEWGCFWAAAVMVILFILAHPMSIDLFRQWILTTGFQFTYVLALGIMLFAGVRKVFESATGHGRFQGALLAVIGTIAGIICLSVLIIEKEGKTVYGFSDHSLVVLLLAVLAPTFFLVGMSILKSARSPAPVEKLSGS